MIQELAGVSKQFLLLPRRKWLGRLSAVDFFGLAGRKICWLIGDDDRCSAARWCAAGIKR